jgi:aspartokinase/homoserine dehydrogenase 1
MRPTCVASLAGLALVDVEGSAAPAVAAVASTGVDVLFEAQGPHGLGVAFAVRQTDVARVVSAIEAALGEDVVPPSVTFGVAMVTLVGESTARTANVSGRFFGALGTLGIDVKAIAQRASSRTIAALVSEAGLATAVRAVHSAFNLSAEEVNVLLLGKGVVGGEFLRQLAAERATLARDHGVNLRLVGVVDRRAIVYDERGIDPNEVTSLLAAAPARGAASARELLPRFGEMPVPVLVDCTAEDGMEKLYHTAFAAGAHVVAANKKPLTIALGARKELFTAARRAHRAYRYETTVGASLPVIETLKNLLRTGDCVRKIEGSFSGTLGYLSNELARGVPLVDAVRDAKARGYTEPHPRDDLSGADAARKALILARELGMPLEFEQVEVTPFVPAEMLVHDDVEAFFAALTGWQATFAAQIADRAQNGEVLRHLATVDPETGTARVAPTFVPSDHPSTRLRGTEGFVAFYTDRYAEYPLVVQGAGAGGAVTAAGVLADVLALSQSLRGA